MKNPDNFTREFARVLLEKFEAERVLSESVATDWKRLIERAKHTKRTRRAMRRKYLIRRWLLIFRAWVKRLRK